MTSFRCWLLTSVLILAAAPLAAGQEYKSYDEAMRAGMKLVRDRQYVPAQAPLEAALKLAADDRERMRAYQPLVQVYRQLPEIDKMLEAQEFVIPRIERRAGRSLSAGDLASFLHQRGKSDEGITRYEARLKKDPQDIVALTVLNAIYTRTKRDANRSADIAQRLKERDLELTTALAQRLEKDSEAAPQMAATLLKDAATAWQEAGDNAKALAAAKKSAATRPQPSTDILVYQWHDGLGDVFLAVGEPALAVAQFEAILTSTNIAGLRPMTEKKLALAKAALAKQ